MATSWKIQNKFGDSGPDWDAMSTGGTCSDDSYTTKATCESNGETWTNDDTHEYDALTSHYWDWSSDWTISAKFSSSNSLIWAAASNRWQDDSMIYKKLWTVMNITKFQEATET